MRRSDSRLISLISVVSATALVACSGSDTPDAGTTPDTGTTVADTGVVADSGTTTPDSGVEEDAGVVEDAGVERCIIEDEVAINEDATCAGEWVATVRGILETADGAGLDEARAQVCVRSPTGVLSCLQPVRSCNGGEWEVLVPDIAAQPRCVEGLVMRTFAFGQPFAETYCNFDVAGQGPRMALSSPVQMFEVTPVENLPAIGTPEVERTIAFTGGLEMDVTPDGITDQFTREDYDLLGAVRVAGDISTRPCFYPAGTDYDAMYGFTPTINITTEGGFPFRIQTTLAENTMVDLFVLGGLDCQIGDEHVEEGHWQQYATVSVDANGVIAGNMPCLNWFAYKAQ